MATKQKKITVQEILQREDNLETIKNLFSELHTNYTDSTEEYRLFFDLSDNKLYFCKNPTFETCKDFESMINCGLLTKSTYEMKDYPRYISNFDNLIKFITFNIIEYLADLEVDSVFIHNIYVPRKLINQRKKSLSIRLTDD